MDYTAALFLLSFVHMQHAYVKDHTCEGQGYICLTFTDCPPNRTLHYSGCTGWKNCCNYPDYAWCNKRGGSCKANCKELEIEHPYGRCSREELKCCITIGKSSKNRW
uniref:Putative carboxypeptidase inhibitor n=1 Tax=Rhipicephalus pulchellus TaxID=72859 RepID=L7MC94_RHIPC